MSKPILFMMLFISSIVSAQQEKQSQLQQNYLMTPSPDKIYFSYDAQGNQTERNFIKGITPIPMPVARIKDTVGKETDLQKFLLEDRLSFYPNPVHDELHLEWELFNDNSVEYVNVYQLNGQLLQSFTGLTKTNSQTILFSNYPNGIYILVLGYSNGEQKDLKILKK